MRFLTDIWEYTAAGGEYMLPIFGVSVIMISLILHRLWNFWASMRALGRVLDTGVAALSPGNFWQRPFMEYAGARSDNPRIDAELRESLSKRWVSLLNTGGKPILLCASLATMLGLLGTVSGMISTFDAMRVFGSGNTKSMAAGISEALITTQSGLMVGVTGVVFGNLLNRLTFRLTRRINHFFIMLERVLGNRDKEGL